MQVTKTILIDKCRLEEDIPNQSDQIYQNESNVKPCTTTLMILISCLPFLVRRRPRIATFTNELCLLLL